ncbi:hypothetical protein K491DRAFT_579026, partial [Lophiostoma macrostomum CBS 122681]
MTDVASVQALADSQPAPVSFYTGPAPATYTNGSPALDGINEEEDSSTIKCICGFSDDDGNTVLCEKCDTWQHIVCYYESAHHVPDVHECVDCQPRAVDSKSAVEKQRMRRELHSIGERKGKPKTAPKSHKKRVKDPLGAVQPNGWAVHSNHDHYYGNERKSGSPRDLPPAAKRPKTSHRTSGSVSMLSQTPALAPASRKRASSTMQNGHSPVKSPTSPEGPSEEWSPEFMNLYRQPSPPSTDTNSYTGIRVANDIALWLRDRDALAEATGGLQPGDVFQRIDQTIEDFDAPLIQKNNEENPNVTAHGLHPQWQFLTVDTMVPPGAYIGELKGRIGRKEDYFAEPDNRWDLLRHPEPFVFFPPHLPIYIDTRHEGTILRYARRSCKPNMQMKILTQGPDHGYHFCFVAMHDIDPGEELTVGWEIDPEIKQRLENAVTNGDIRKEGFKKMEPWVACVLSNFGGCACDTSRNGECLLERARRPNNIYAEPLPPKSIKGRKPKKQQFSPLSTGHATNSRAGSEPQIRNGGDDDNVDSRSTSGSHKSSSRDITPATHFSVDGGELKMSDRERRKLQQQERLFEQLEYDEQHKGKRGKRNSAGSTLNTPGLSSSVRFDQRPVLLGADMLEQRQLGHTEASPSYRGPREHANGVARKISGNSSKSNGRAAAKPKPVYVDSSTQTDPGKFSAPPTPMILPKARVIKRPISFKHKLLQQAIEDRQQRDRNRSASVKTEARSPALKDVSSSKPSPTPSGAYHGDQTMGDAVTDIQPITTATTTDSILAKEESSVPSVDVEMKEADDECAPPSSPQQEEMADAPTPASFTNTSDPPMQPLPPAPPWPSSAIPTPSIEQVHVPESAPSPKPADLHIALPPPESAPSILSTNPVTTPGSISGNGIAQSPVGVASAPSPFSPSVTNAVNPGPMRKKLSLSDYTSRRAKLAQTQSSGMSATPPLAQSQSAISPTLSTASLPTQTSPPSKPTEAVLPAVMEEPMP